MQTNPLFTVNIPEALHLPTVFDDQPPGGLGRKAGEDLQPARGVLVKKGKLVGLGPDAQGIEDHILPRISKNKLPWFPACRLPVNGHGPILVCLCLPLKIIPR